MQIALKNVFRHLRSRNDRKLLLRSSSRVRSRHIGVFPSEQRHELVFARAILGRSNRSNFAKAVGAALGSTRQRRIESETSSRSLGL